MNTLTFTTVTSFKFTEALPKNMGITIKGKLKDDRFFAILCIGPRSKIYVSISKKQMREIEVTKVDSYRDGGTVIYRTVEGDFHFPTPYEKDAVPTFKGEPLEIL